MLPPSQMVFLLVFVFIVVFPHLELPPPAENVPETLDLCNQRSRCCNFHTFYRSPPGLFCTHFHRGKFDSIQEPGKWCRSFISFWKKRELYPPFSIAVWVSDRNFTSPQITRIDICAKYLAQGQNTLIVFGTPPPHSFLFVYLFVSANKGSQVFWVSC